MSTRKETELLAHQALAYLTSRKGEQAVFEVRIPKASRAGTASGYFSDPAMAAIAVSRYDNPDVAGIYITLNPVDPALLSRSANKITQNTGSGTTTSDKEILTRWWLPIDIDAKRPAGISSSEEEFHAALTMAGEIRDQLRSHEWPEPLFATSGNGAHLLYPIDLPNGPQENLLVQNCLHALHGLYSTEQTQVDTVVFNPGRIWKLYGTWARKGDNTKDRPHRRAEIISSPDVTGVVTREQLEALGSLAEQTTYTGPTMSEESIKDMDKWLAKVGVSVHAGPLPWKNGQKWMLQECAFDPSHNKPIVAVIDNRPIYKCLHNSCQEHGWKAFREKVEPGYSAPKNLKQRVIEGEDLCSLPVISAAVDMTPGELHAFVGTLKDEKVKGITDFRKAVEAEKKKRRSGEDREDGFAPPKRDLASYHTFMLGLVKRGIVPKYCRDESTGRIFRGDPANPEYVDVEDEATDVLCTAHAEGMTWSGYSDASRLIEKIANANSVNRLAYHLEQFKWDGVQRLPTMLSQYFAVKDSAYTREVSVNFMVGLAMRGLRPGCQMDNMLVLEGGQGIGKSRAARILGGPFFGSFYGKAETINDRVRFVQAIDGKLVVEWSELNTLRASNMEKVKAMISESSDNVRGAYARDASDHLRTCVFIGTTNNVDSRYINDSTGARRFWAVLCEDTIDTNGLANAREQLLAEAVTLAKAGHAYWQFSAPAGVELDEETSARQALVTETAVGEEMLMKLTDPDMLLSGHFSKTPTGQLYLGAKAAMLPVLWEMCRSTDSSAPALERAVREVLAECGFLLGNVREGGKVRKTYLLHDNDSLVTVHAKSPARLKRVLENRQAILDSVDSAEASRKGKPVRLVSNREEI
jgi:hypothetical protein